MHLYSILLGAFAATALGIDEASVRGCRYNSCLEQVTTRQPGHPTLHRSRVQDCKSFQRVTVVTVPSVAGTPKQTLTKISPTAIPSYASSCLKPKQYARACECMGITAATHYTAQTVSKVVPTATSIAPADTTGGNNSTNTASAVLPTATNVQNVKPATQRQIAYEHSNSDSTLFSLTANFTALANSTLVNIEDFLPFVANATCGGSPIQQITIQFTDTEAYNLAAKHWPASFELITSGADYCGTPDGERTYYNVTNPTFSGLSAVLQVSQITLYEAVSRVAVVYGQTGTPVQKRGLEPRATGSTTIDINTNSFAEFVNGFSTIFTGSGGAPVSCEGCGIYGQLVLSGGYDCSFVNGLLTCTGAFVRADFENIDINVALSISVVNGYTISEAFTLDEIPLPSICVGYQCDLVQITPSAALKATLGFNVDDAPNFEVDNIGFNATLSDAYFEMDFLDSSGTTSGGWSPNFTPYQPIFDENVYGFQVSASIGPVISIDIGVLSIDYSASLNLESPRLTATFTYDEGNNCGDPEDGDNAILLSLAADLDMYADLTGPAVSSSLDPINFFDISFPNIITQQCIPV